MKVKIDADLCTGCGLCTDSVPDVFKMGDDVAQVLKADVPANLEKHLDTIDLARKQGVDLLVFPELSLTGYNLQDLVYDNGTLYLLTMSGLSVVDAHEPAPLQSIVQVVAVHEVHWLGQPRRLSFPGQRGCSVRGMPRSRRKACERTREKGAGVYCRLGGLMRQLCG